jgi:hypothetical protein
MKIVRSIIDCELCHRLKSTSIKIDTEYTFKKEKRMSTKTIEVCVGVGMNQIFPEYITIEIPQESNKITKAEREKLLAEIMERDQELGLYNDLPNGKE